MIIEKNVKFCKCSRCGYEWKPMDESKLPLFCSDPKCHSPYWNKPYKNIFKLSQCFSSVCNGCMTKTKKGRCLKCGMEKKSL